MSQALSFDQALKAGIAHHNAGNIVQAENIYRELLKHNPNYGPALHMLGVLAHECQNQPVAEQLIKRAIELHPTEAVYHSNLSLVYLAMGRANDAAKAARRAVELNPNYFRGYANLAAALFRLYYFEEAIEVCRRALALEPNSAETHNTLGTALQQTGRLAEALASYEKAIACQPNFALAHHNYALGLLLTGDFERGWEEQEWRAKYVEAGARPFQQFVQPRWQGEDIAGKTLLLHAEQGYGDAIQFIRYAELAALRGARVIVECQAEMKPLLASARGVAAIHARGEPLPAFDYQIPLMSLPLVFKTRLDTIPQRVPYLAPPPEKIAAFRAALAGQPLLAGKSRKVGLGWASSTRDHPMRSMSVAHLAPLFDVKEVGFVSLQKGPAAAEVATCGLPMVDLGEELRDFADTAALISQLDLVISVDTAVAHLAGSLARPLWVMLPLVPDGRWLLERADSPWYPTARLFRRAAGEEWGAVVATIAQELRVFY